MAGLINQQLQLTSLGQSCYTGIAALIPEESTHRDDQQSI